MILNLTLKILIFQAHLNGKVEHCAFIKAPQKVVTPIFSVQKASGGGDGEFDDVDIQQLNWVEGNRKVF